MIDDSKYKRLYKRSQEHYDLRKAAISNYNDDKHRDYCNQYNSGVTHFGISPMKLRIELIHYDIFHLRSAITRKLLHYFRNLIN